jgi:hypothetical protein
MTENVNLNGEYKGLILSVFLFERRDVGVDYVGWHKGKTYLHFIKHYL